MSRRHKSSRTKGGRCACCSRYVGNSAGKGTSAWRHLRKLGIKRRPKNGRVEP